jgi:hypothetical protein
LFTSSVVGWAMDVAVDADVAGPSWLLDRVSP